MSDQPKRDWSKVAGKILLQFVEIAVTIDSEIGQGGTWDDLLESGLCGDSTLPILIEVHNRDQFLAEAAQIHGLNIIGQRNNVFAVRGTLESVAILAQSLNVIRVY